MIVSKRGGFGEITKRIAAANRGRDVRGHIDLRKRLTVDQARALIRSIIDRLEDSGPAAQLSAALQGVLTEPAARKSKNPAETQPARKESSGRMLTSISIAEAKSILADSNASREDLINLGVERFGIPRSQLSRFARSDIQNVVAAAASHEESLALISRAAAQQGSLRTS